MYPFSEHSIKVPYLDFDRIIGSQEFISKHNLKLREPSEIIAKYAAIQSEEAMFDFRPEVLIDFIPFEYARPFLNKEYIAKIDAGGETYSYIDKIEICLQDFLDYMVFAWGKALDERGISASRSINKLSMWLWLMGRDDLETLITDEDLYNPYGSPALIAVCEKLDITVPDNIIEFSKNPC